MNMQKEISVSIYCCYTSFTSVTEPVEETQSTLRCFGRFRDIPPPPYNLAAGLQRMQESEDVTPVLETEVGFAHQDVEVAGVVETHLKVIILIEL